MPDAFSIDRTLLGRLDLTSAISVECVIPRQDLPSRLLEQALGRRVPEVASYLTGLYAEGLVLSGGDSLQALKPAGGLRPLTILTFPQRVLYQALSALFEEESPSRPRSYETWEAFQAAPLDESKASHIAHADISSFYFYVDHALLTEEIVNQTGDAELASAVSELLHGVMQRRVGLPQLYRASDVLSEVVVDMVERRLIRSGLSVWRYNDDFRLGAASWRAARQSIEQLDVELRAIGLTLNEEKTYVESRADYEKWVGAVDKAWDEIDDAVDFDFRSLDLYADDLVIEADDDEEGDAEDLEAKRVAAAERALEYWNERVRKGERSPRAPINVFRRLLTRAFAILTRYSSDAGLETCSRVLAIERQLTPMVSRYLREIGKEHSKTVISTVQAWLNSRTRYFSPWQRAWLLNPLLVQGPLSLRTVASVEAMLSPGNPDILRARAALLLAAKRRISPKVLADLYQTLSEPSRPDVVAALTALAGAKDPQLEAVRREGPIERWVVDYVEATRHSR